MGSSGRGAAAAAGGGPPRRLLGVVAPGDRLPLPLGWEAEGVELQLRPLTLAAVAGGGRMTVEVEAVECSGAGDDVLASMDVDAEAQVEHQWSGGVQMVSLDEGGARLLCCR